MKDKFDVIAENLADNDGKLYRHEIAQYLREQFAVTPCDDVKIDLDVKKVEVREQKIEVLNRVLNTWEYNNKSLKDTIYSVLSDLKGETT